MHHDTYRIVSYQAAAFYSHRSLALPLFGPAAEVGSHGQDDHQESHYGSSCHESDAASCRFIPCGILCNAPKANQALLLK